MTFKKGDMQAMMDRNLALEETARILEAKACLYLVNLDIPTMQSEEVPMEFVGYLVEPWGLAPYYAVSHSSNCIS